MANRYRFRAALHGHEKDVRGVCAGNFPSGSIVSVSRDITARLWVPNEHDVGFSEGHMMSGHNNFVSCVCVMPPDDKYPHGLIMTGSSDHTILAYTLDSPQPLFKLEGHTNNVCSLAAGKFGSLLSASWDKTAKVWLNQKCVMTLSGHEAAVWAVAIMPEGGYMLTGSADKLIKLWRAGKCQQTFAGHTDCVRAVAVISASEFLSAANDGTIRRWLTSGECTHTYYGHSNFVYSLALLPNGEDFISGGEDRTLRVWSGGQCTQTIPHPTESVWTVCALANGDIVTGASDGVVRLFTTAPERAAEEEIQKAYEAEVAASSIPAQIGDIKTDQLSGPEALLNPGKRDGQTMMIRRDNKVEAHQWTAAEGRWVKIGDVTGGESGEGAAGGKKTFKGKEYDYVFDVELDEGKAPLKLPFNKGDDPWMAAHNFLQDNDMSPMFLDQVAKFILSQTKDVTIGPPEVQFKDPFSEVRPPSQGQAVTYYPKTDYLGFDQANVQAILGKLREFNSKMAESDRINENVLESFEHMMAGQAPAAAQLDNLWKALQWPADCVFPAVDVLRLCIRHTAVCEHFCRPSDGKTFLSLLQRWLQDTTTPVPVQLLALRTLCNMFRQSSGLALIHAEFNPVLNTLTSMPASSNKNIQVAKATVLLNLSVLQFSKPGNNEAKAELIKALVSLTETITEAEAQFRLLVAVGTLLSGDANACELIKSGGLVKFTSSCRKIVEPKKISECAKSLTQDLLQ